jgi:hypothetical protein
MLRYFVQIDYKLILENPYLLTISPPHSTRRDPWQQNRIVKQFKDQSSTKDSMWVGLLPCSQKFSYSLLPTDGAEEWSGAGDLRGRIRVRASMHAYKECESYLHMHHMDREHDQIYKGYKSI